MKNVEMNEHIWNGMRHYIRELHAACAVDDTKMHFRSYKPLEECMKLWEIDPLPVTNGNRNNE